MEPGKTSFFQALGIPSKIARGTIEIVSDVQVVTAGTRVGSSLKVLSLALKYPTIVSITHSLVNSYKNLLATALLYLCLVTILPYGASSFLHG
ncbi:hypothetical protein SISSUDRAFT_994804 [Sistotremastrum suecicum HHB10207 ss-3]|uniref:Large ribosomal subunit protein uL10-like insertion domain-containing protein n=1 Tax=Sistotremastrum suecicum HHB10207 ss-3 TaxID=1314776 RepID=A0A165X075_9AGAM|nr:hypothetical protein SISSUDRAFT_994804 [Sistotremastrum suecicum HHB10207 ss-3]